MAGPLVSIVIPAFNASAWIVECVQSASGQTWKNIEILVVDDGSTDDTVARAASIGDPRLRILRQDNAGASAARNHGLREARGEFVQFLDADDLISPDKIATQVASLAARPDAISSCAWYSFTGTPANAQQKSEPVWGERDPIRWLVRSLTGEGMMQPAGWLLPRSVADRAGPWNESLTLHDDAEFFARMLVNASENVFVEGPAVFYRSTPDSLSRRRGRPAAESALEVCVLREKTLLAARDDREVRSALATQYAQFAYEFSGSHRDLSARAVHRMKALLAEPANSVGGQVFRALAAITSFETALRIRSALSGSEKVVPSA